MRRQLAQWAAVMMTLAGVAPMAAQEASSPRAGSLVVAVIPIGSTSFTISGTGKEPGFAVYAPAGDVEIYLNRHVSAEAEIGGGIGVSQDLESASSIVHRRSPSLLTYSGNIVVAAPSDGSLAPYMTIGVGGLTLLSGQALGITSSRTFFTGNVGAGVRWFNSKGRWGVRADYRFIAVRADDQAPAFFGREERYANRGYGALLIKVGR